MRILIVDDHILFREALSSTLRNQPDFEVVAEAGSIGEAMRLVVEVSPHVILLDVSLPDGSGLEALNDILKLSPMTTVIMLSATETSSTLLTAIAHGAKGYLLKNIPVAKLLASLRGLQKGEAALSRTMTGKLVNELARLNLKDSGSSQTNSDANRELLSLLTPREREVLKELASEASNQEIAERLVIAENTVKIHIHRILKKLNLYNRHEAGRLARNLL